MLPFWPGKRQATRVVDLARSPSDRWADIRRSYHALIHKAQREYEIIVGATDALGRGYIAAHRAAGGSRASGTYAWQLEWLKNGLGLVVCAFEKGARPETYPTPVAASYAIVDRLWAYYASGPATVKNVQHALQWELMQALAERGVRSYELGYLPENPTPKEESIAVFKRGFGGQDWFYAVRKESIG